METIIRLWQAACADNRDAAACAALADALAEAGCPDSVIRELHATMRVRQTGGTAMGLLLSAQFTVFHTWLNTEMQRRGS